MDGNIRALFYARDVPMERKAITCFAFNTLTYSHF
jgi:hypothetical protein